MPANQEMPIKLPLRIGLTGGIASGKSTAQAYFEKLGVTCIDHDKLARDVVSPKSKGLKQLQEEFGSDIVTEDGTLNRPKLKGIIFTDSAAKRKVENIIHPLVFEASDTIRAAYSSEPYILIVSPLLIESGHYKDMFKLIVVHTPPHIQLQRLLQRDGMTKELALSIIQSQVSAQERIQAADFLIDNSHGFLQLEEDVLKCHNAILKML